MTVQSAPAPSADTVAEVIELLEQAERPIMMIGAGARFSECQAELKEFAEQSNIPVVHNNKAFGVMPPDHPLNCGSFTAMAAAVS